MTSLLRNTLCAWCVIQGAIAIACERPEIVSVEKIWDQGRHNAFTDLIRWRDRWYCAFREADFHMHCDSKVRIIESDDGKTWKSAAAIGGRPGIDLRDPKLSVTPDDRLMILVGAVHHEKKKAVRRYSQTMFSSDGKQWTEPHNVLPEGEWLWRVTWHDGRCYGISTRPSSRELPEAKAAAAGKPFDPGPAEWKPKLFVGDNGLDFERITHLEVPGDANESTIRFLPDGKMLALVRREGGNQRGWIGVSEKSFTDWKWHETNYRFGGPNSIVLPDGTMWAASRQCVSDYPEKERKTVLARLGPDTYEPVLTLPSGGDTSYPGLVWHDGLLWMSYYSSHEGKSNIYLAVIRVK